MGWFYGFKRHIIVNHVGDILAAKITPANVDDRKPVPELAKELSGNYTVIKAISVKHCLVICSTKELS